MTVVPHLHFEESKRPKLLKDPEAHGHSHHSHALPVSKSHAHPTGSTGKENASIYFIGNATTVIEWQGLRILTDPNFLHAGDHVHLGPGVTAQRVTNPAVDLHELPPLDCILLSHYHADHFDQLVEASLNRTFPIITTPHAKECLTSKTNKDEPFMAVTALDVFRSAMLHIDGADDTNGSKVVKVTGMPGKHVPPVPITDANAILRAVPPTNGWMLELGYASSASSEGAEAVQTGYRIYISGDTLFVDELKTIPQWLEGNKVDLMLVHLGGTTLNSTPPLLMVTMDGKQGLQLIQLIEPDVTIPIHFDDYDAFLSPLSDFKDEVNRAELQKKVVYLDRGEQYEFEVRNEVV
ncbi:Metallo-hydrolase/oxidoreductase [Thozetella sp. PMI_491]|nr:Metallo-hydrolase/oxidoreductase [Thozetella sp. PMI_491]